jgi:3-carboxy-cis,cis-muconate cycloisomerase
VSGPPTGSPLLWGLLGDDEIAAQLSVEAELLAMAAFERALARAEAAEGVIPPDAAEAIVTRLERFAPDVAMIRAAAARDGVVGVGYVHQLRHWVGPPHEGYVHFGATSQDLVDTALMLRLRPIVDGFTGRIEVLAARLADLADRFGSRRLMGRTRMQDALPITAGDRLASWRAPLVRHLERLDELLPRLLVLQFGGPVGTLDRLGDKGPAVAARLAAALDLGLPERAWHAERDAIAGFASWLSLVSGSLGKTGADIALMAQMGGEIVLEGGGGSSAMPHKSNPVGAEVLVALARYNATLLAGAHQALVHEQERSGAAWTLEWLVLPQMLLTTAASLRTAIALLDAITGLGGPA